MTTKIYALLDSDGKIRYVGKTSKSLEKRLTEHLYVSRRGIKCHRCDWIRSLLKVGFLPTIQLIGEVNGNGCREEQAWIKWFREEGFNLTNLTDGGDGFVGYKPSVDTRRNMSLSAKKRYNSSEKEKNRLRNIAIGNTNRRGKKFSLESRLKMSLAHKGVRLSKEHCLSMSEGRIGIKMSKEHQAKISNSLRVSPLAIAQRKKLHDRLRGGTLSEEHKQKLSKAHLGKKCSPEWRLHMSMAQLSRQQKIKELRENVA